MASGGLGNLTVDLLLETAQWIAGLNKAEHDAQKFADAIGNKFEAMSDRALSALKGMAAGAVAAFAVDHIVGFINETQKLADSLDEMAQKTGASLQFLAQMSVNAEMSGTSIEGLAGALGKFNKATAEAFKDSKSGPAQAFKDLGISILDAAGKLKSSEALFLEAATQLSAIEEPSLRAAKAMELFGKKGAELIPLMLSLANQSAELKAATKDYGDAMARLAPIAGALEESQAIMHTNMKTLAAVVGTELIPYFNELIKVWNGATESSGSLAQSARFMFDAFKGIVLAFDAIITTGAQLVIVLAGIAEAIQLQKIGQFKAAADTMSAAMKDAAHTGELYETRLKAMADPLGAATSGHDNLNDAVKRLGTSLQTTGADLVAYRVKWLRAMQQEEVDDINEQRDRAEKNAKKKKERLKELAEYRRKWDIAVKEAEVDDINDIADAEEKAQRDKEAGMKTAADAEAKILQEQMELKAKYLAKELENWRSEWGTFYDGLEKTGHDAFESLFDGTKGGWDSMLHSMRDSFKKMLVDYLYSAFVKPLILKLGAQMLGMPGQNSNGVMGLGGNTGFDSLSKLGSNAYDWYSKNYGAASYYEGGSNFVGPMPEGYTAAATGGSFGTAPTWTSAGTGAYGMAATAGAGIVGGYFGGAVAGAYGAGDRGVQNSQNYAATGAAIGMQVYGPIGAAVGAVIGTIVGISTDPDPDAMRKAVFGQISEHTKGITPWTGESAFGKFGFSEGEWLSDSDMGDTMKQVVAGIATMDNALAQFMSPEQIASVTSKLDDAAKQYELGMEHTGVAGIGAIIKDRLSIIAGEFNAALGKFVDDFDGTTDDLTSIVTSYMQASNLASDFDPEAIVASIQPREAMDVYQEQRGSLNDYIAGLDTSAESMQGLVASMISFQQTTVQMIAAIDAVSAQMHDMFMSTREKIEQSQMTPEERYNYLQAQTEALYKQLETETDPAEIQKLAAKINANINAAWELLTPEQQQAMAESFTTRLTMLDDAVTTKMGALREVVIDDAQTVMADITARLEAVFGTAEAAANTQAAAAQQNMDAANTPVHVVVTVGDDGTVTAAG